MTKSPYTMLDAEVVAAGMALRGRDAGVVWAQPWERNGKLLRVYLTFGADARAHYGIHERSKIWVEMTRPLTLHGREVAGMTPLRAALEELLAAARRDLQAGAAGVSGVWYYRPSLSEAYAALGLAPGCGVRAVAEAARAVARPIYDAGWAGEVGPEGDELIRIGRREEVLWMAEDALRRGLGEKG